MARYRTRIFFVGALLFSGLPFLSHTAQAAQQTGTGTLLANSNVRSSAGVAAHNVLTVLPAGTQVTVTGSSRTWDAVTYGAGKTGWIAAALVRSVPTPVPAAATSAPASVTAAQSPSTVSVATAVSPTFPHSVTEQDAADYWQLGVNALRARKGLRQLALDPRLTATAHTWATYLGVHGIVTHTRPDGSTPEQWIATQGIPFTVQFSPNGWVTNYFTENIAEKLSVKPTLAGVKTALDQVMDMFMAEGPSGLHYQSVFKSDWNSMGVGWYPIDNGNGTYTIYFVFHYASLAPMAAAAPKA